MPIRPVAVFLVVIAWCQPREGLAKTISDPVLGYSFTVPDDWVPIPREAVDVLEQRAVAASARGSFHWIAAYQPRTRQQLFQYPYLLVQVTPYPDHRDHESITEQGLKELAASISGLNTSSVHKALSPAASKLLGDVSPGTTGTYFTEPPGLCMNFEIQVNGIGPVHGAMKGLIAKDQMISLNVYTRKDDQSDPSLEPILSSFSLAADRQVKLSSGVLGAAGRGAVAGGLVGALSALVAVIFRRRKKESGASNMS